MKISGQKIGVWGFGIVGKSALQFLLNNTYTPLLLSEDYTPEDIVFLKRNNICYYKQSTDLHHFLETCDKIIVSPGIDTRQYSSYSHKWITEADILYKSLSTPIIAVTGTIGKTSLTTLLEQILSAAHYSIAIGGNIGTGMLDLIPLKKENYVLLELSSFQLEHCASFAPYLAIITNIYPNHLDRHGTFEQYKEAKFTLFKHQKENGHALIPLELYDSLPQHFRSFYFFSLKKPQVFPHAHHTYYYIENEHVYKKTALKKEPLIAIECFPDTSFLINWVIVTAALDILGISLHECLKNPISLTLPDHRLGKPIVHNGIFFYNDSKSTIIEATYGAIEKISPHIPYLIFGGLSKGVDRTTSLIFLKNKIKKLICFGKEAELLAQHAALLDIPASYHDTLEEAFNATVALVQKDDHILFSPGGSSFDLFSDYKARGKRFEELIKSYVQQTNAIRD